MSNLSSFLKHDLPDLSTLNRSDWFDNSTIETFQDCPRLAWYSYAKGMEQKSAPMAAGTVWHAALAELHQTGNFQAANLILARSYEAHKGILQTAANRLSFGNLNQALSDYQKKFGNDPSIVYHEQEFKFGILMKDESPNLGPNQPPFWFVGRFDGLITFIGDLLLLENKTAAQINAGYLKGLEMSRQASGYVYAVKKILEANGYKGPPLKGVLFNIVKLGSSIEFSRFVALRHEAQLQEWETETKELVQQIRASWFGAEKPIKNTRQCNRYGQCQFIPLCQAWTHKDKENPPGLISNYQISKWRPF